METVIRVAGLPLTPPFVIVPMLAVITLLLIRTCIILPMSAIAPMLVILCAVMARMLKNAYAWTQCPVVIGMDRRPNDDRCRRHIRRSLVVR